MCCFPLHAGAKQQHNALTQLLHLCVADREQWAAYILWWTGLPRIIYTLARTCRLFWRFEFLRCTWCSRVHDESREVLLSIHSQNDREYHEGLGWRHWLARCECCYLMSVQQIDTKIYVWCQECHRWMLGSGLRRLFGNADGPLCEHQVCSNVRRQLYATSKKRQITSRRAG